MIINLARVAVGGVMLFMLSQVPPALGGNGCGLVGETCCQTEPQCETGALCIGDMCTPCGGLGQFCCPIGMCDTGLTCLADFAETVEGQGGGAAVGPLLCVACGGAGQPCCDATCDSGFVCELCLFNGNPNEGGGAGPGAPPCPIGATDVCEPCGGFEEKCCDGQMCDEGFDCNLIDTETIDQGSAAGRNGSALAVCLPCGAIGEPCCDEQTCIGDNLICGGEFCEACGDIGAQCCPNETCPGSEGLCISGTCIKLPTVATMSSSALVLLVLTLSAVAALWMRRTQA
jgi:hypothetical protein